MYLLKNDMKFSEEPQRGTNKEMLDKFTDLQLRRLNPGDI